jgi:hypothetical protein
MSFDIHALLQDENRILERWHVSGAHKEGSANILQRGAKDRATAPIGSRAELLQLAICPFEFDRPERNAVYLLV